MEHDLGAALLVHIDFFAGGTDHDGRLDVAHERAGGETMGAEDDIRRHALKFVFVRRRRRGGFFFRRLGLFARLAEAGDQELPVEIGS